MGQTNDFLDNAYYLTDGGLETSLTFNQGIELRHFAAFELLQHEQGRRILKNYYDAYLRLADHYRLGFIAETPTWRASLDWGAKLGYSKERLDTINRDATNFMKSLADERKSGIGKVIVSGNIGPRGDGYKAENLMSVEEAMTYHLPQVQSFVLAGVDVVSALTLTYSEEAIGIVNAARLLSIPVVISYTVETDGRLPSKETLKEAIEKTDAATDAYTSYYMLNCAHPDHFKNEFIKSGEWKNRIFGVRANASAKSHAELDNSTSLDAGDKSCLSHGYVELTKLLPYLKVIGGCCGTDDSHIEEICKRIFVNSK